MGDAQFKANTIQFIERYKSLLDHVENRFFEIKKVKIVEWPDLEHKPKWQALFISFFFPYFVFQEMGSFVSVVCFITIGIWLLCSFLWMLTSLIIFDCTVLALMSCSSTSQTTNSNPQPFGVILTVCMFLFPFVSYGQVIWFLFHRKNPRLSKIVWLSGFILLILVVFFMVVYHYSINTSVPLYLSFKTVFWILALTFSFTSSLIFIYSFSILAIFEATPSVLNSLKGLFWLSRPIGLDLLEQVIFEPIKMNEIKWQFCDLSLEEIRFLREWSQQNLEVNEKKNIPIAFMLTIGGLLASTPPVQNFLSTLIQNILNLANDYIAFGRDISGTATYSSNIPVFLPTLLAVIFLLVLWAIHMQNFATQGVIVQLCVIAEYAKEREEAEAQQKVKKSSIIHSFVDWLSKLI